MRRTIASGLPVDEPACQEDAGAIAMLLADRGLPGWHAGHLACMLTDPATIALVARSIQSGATSLDAVALARVVLDEAELLAIAVHMDRQQRGLGRALLSALCSRVGARGVKRLLLEVDVANIPALALYQRAGFTEIGRRKGYYVATGKSPSDALILCLTL